MWGAPYTGYLTLAFLFGVVVLMALDPPIGTWTVATLVIIIPALIVGWYAVRGRVMEIAREREGFTGQFPVVANRPPPRDKDEDKDLKGRQLSPAVPLMPLVRVGNTRLQFLHHLIEVEARGL